MVDTTTARAQLACLEEQAEDMRRIKRELIAYRRQLNVDWTAREMTHINRVIDDLSERSGRLAGRLDALCAVIAATMEEAEAETATAAALAATLM